VIAPDRDAGAAEAAKPLLRDRLLDYLELTKPRVTTMVLVTTLVGFYLGSAGGIDFGLLLRTLAGTALAAAGAAALNQYLEREEDARMLRTRGRPIPSGRVEPVAALLFGCLLAVAGIGQLWLGVEGIAAGLVALTVLSYLFVYTPLKKRTTFCTLIGALPGALPPLVGWTAAEGAISAGGLVLFAILFVWQLPHALAIACLYQDDYERGGFVLLPVRVKEGGATGRLVVAHALVLLPISLLPALSGFAGPAYFAGAILLGLGFVVVSIPLATEGSARAARRVLLASVAYLPALLVLMALDRRVPLP
jgi:protoheme IX farnesyltransferase